MLIMYSANNRQLTGTHKISNPLLYIYSVRQKKVAPNIFLQFSQQPLGT